MRITIDTSIAPHRIEIEGDCTIGELTDFLSKYYPDFAWRDIKIGGKQYTINLPQTRPWVQPLTNPNPWIGGPLSPPQPYTGDPFTGGPSIVYCSDTNSFTNAVTGDPVTFTGLTK